MSDDTPRNDVLAQTTALKELVGQYFGPGQAWSKLIDAKSHVLEKVEAEIAGSRSHREGLTPDDLMALLVGYIGLRGEFNNGPQIMLDRLFDEPSESDEVDGQTAKKRSYPELVQRLVGMFDGKSQAAILGIQEGQANPFAEETKLGAIHRMADEIDAWAKANQGRLGDTSDYISDWLEEYRADAQEIDQFVVRARALLDNPTTALGASSGQSGGIT